MSNVKSKIGSPTSPSPFWVFTTCYKTFIYAGITGGDRIQRLCAENQSHGPTTSTVPPAVVPIHSADNDAGSETCVASLKERPATFRQGCCYTKEQGTRCETSLQPWDVFHRPSLPVTPSLIVKGQRNGVSGNRSIGNHCPAFRYRLVTNAG